MTRPHYSKTVFPRFPALVICAGLLGIIVSLSVTMFTLQLEQSGHDRVSSGIANGFQLGAVILTLFMLPHGLRMFPNAAIVAFLSGLEALFWLAILTGAELSFGWHCLLRLFLGANTCTLYIMLESMANQLCTSGKRGRSMAIYTATVLLGFAAGPFLLSLLPDKQYGTMILIAAFAAICTVFWKLKDVLPGFSLPDIPIRQWVMQYPVVVGVGICYGMIEAAMFAHLPLAGMQVGYPEAQALRLLTFVMLGGLLLQYNIGRHADQKEARQLLQNLLLLGIALNGLLAFTAGSELSFWLCLLVYGGILAGHYTVVLVLLGNQAKSEHCIATGTLLLAFSYGIGGLTGPPLAGLALDRFGGTSLFIVFAACHLACLIWIWMIRRSQCT